MKHGLRYIFLIAILWSFSSCEEMFVHEIQFENEIEPEMLVLEGKLGLWPYIKVSHSSFISGQKRSSEKNDTVKYVEDAEVTMRHKGTTYPLEHYKSGVYKLPSRLFFNPLDTVEIIASHPRYATVTARQVMPDKVNSDLLLYELQPNHHVLFKIGFDKYAGNADDIIGVRARSVLGATSKRTHRRETMGSSYLYSNDIVFAGAENLEAGGYYGTYYGYLYFPSSVLKEPKTIEFFVDCGKLRRVIDEHENDIQIAELMVEIYSFTRDAYIYEKSVEKYDATNYTIEAPSGFPQEEGNFMDDIVDGLKEVLGEQEPRSVYSNVEGGLGCVGGVIYTYHQAH